MKSGYIETRLISQSTEKPAKILELENPSGTVPQHGTCFGSSAVSAQKLFQENYHNFMHTTPIFTKSQAFES